MVWLLLFSFASCLAQVLEQSFVCVDSLGALLGFCKDGCKADSLSAVSFPGSSSFLMPGTWSECGRLLLGSHALPAFHGDCLELSLLESGRKFAPCVKETRWGS